MPALVDLAKAILRQAESLEKQLDDIGAPQPTLENLTPLHYPNGRNYPEIYDTRQEIVNMSKAMFQLSMGPADSMRWICGPERADLPLLNVMIKLDMHSLVPQQGSISFDDLARKARVHPNLLARIMRLGFANNLFKEEPAGHVAHTSLSSALPMASGWIKLMSRRDHTNAFFSWPEAMPLYEEPVKPGSLPWNVGNDHEQPFFDFLQQEEGGMAMFANAMKSTAALAVGGDLEALIGKMDWHALGGGPLVDLGGGNGHVSVIIAKTFPKLNIIVQDLAANQEPADQTIPQDLKARVTYQVQNFFEPQSVQTNAKAFFMKSILHDWPDEDCVRILRQLLPEVEQGAKIYVCDRALTHTVPRPTHRESMMAFLDLLMWSLLGAKERNVEQWEALLNKADERLKLLDIQTPSGGEHSILTIGF